jgi:uncharacterized protein DUF4342
MSAQLKEAIIDTFKLDPETVDRTIAKIEALIQEGNAHRVTVKDAAGATVIEAPLLVGVVGAALAPVWAAIAAIAALAKEFTVNVERRS